MRQDLPLRRALQARDSCRRIKPCAIVFGLRLGVVSEVVRLSRHVGLCDLPNIVEYEGCLEKMMSVLSVPAFKVDRAGWRTAHNKRSLRERAALLGTERCTGCARAARERKSSGRTSERARKDRPAWFTSNELSRYFEKQNHPRID